MNKKILILGASGNFGSKITKGLAKANIPLIIAGRKLKNLTTLKNETQQLNSELAIEVVTFDIKKEFSQQLSNLKPFVVINTCGPFQTTDYSVALSCIKLSIHYIDLADGRDFVNGISMLNEAAKEKNCLVISGASTVPCLSSAVLTHYRDEFSSIDALSFGIAPGQKTERGLATLQSILSYVGKALKPTPGSLLKIYGWQDLYRQDYPLIGKRWMANCDIPDLDLLPNYFGIKHVRFAAGAESCFSHLSLWMLSWFVRWGFPIKLENYAKIFLKLSYLFDYFGSEDGGMHMIFSGKDKNGDKKTVKWFIIAKNGDGPHIPTIPAIVLAKQLVQGEIKQVGAIPCVNLISLESYLFELRDFNIQVYSDV